MKISIPKATCQNIREALRFEWLETNGLGGYASSSILGCHTRRYHGLLVASLTDPPGRHVLLSKFEDSLCAANREFFLSCHKYPGLFFPRGHQYLEEFLLDGGPVFRYRIGDVVLRKSILMVQGRDLTLVRYELEEAGFPVVLRIKPLLAFRHFHALTRANVDLQVRTYPARRGFMIRPYNALPPLYLQASVKTGFDPAPVWYYNFEHVVEQERGFPFQEDLFQPGIFEVPLTPGKAVTFALSTSEVTTPLDGLWDAERSRRPAAGDSRGIQHLAHEASRFVVRSPDGRPTVIAGYHWFDDWGRDALIALPGLAFCRGLFTEGAAIMETYAKHERNGLLPNFFSPAGHPAAYNTVDASLWYIWAAQQFLALGGEDRVVRTSFWPVIRRILEAYARGTDHEIRMADSGLLHAGTSSTQLTWMDAAVAGRPVTPRHGFAVEINALWLNALAFALDLAARYGEPPPIASGLAGLLARGRQAFNDTFWLEDGEYLADVVTDGTPDRAVRPNQIFAVSLPLTPLTPDRWGPVVQRVRHELLTPFGLRTLSPRDPAYRGRYAGAPEDRDGAYHQGTVWPWLLGAYGEAALRVSPDKPRTGADLIQALAPLIEDHLGQAGLGSVSEIFDGNPPHAPNGCIAQAWSVAELIRLQHLVDSAAAPAPRAPRRSRSQSRRKAS